MLTRSLPRRSGLSGSLAVGLGLAISAAHDAFATQPHPMTPHTVTTCADDDSSGSLRSIIASANTDDDDTIDLTQLACSTITLDSAMHTPSHIVVTQPSLHLLGPGAGALTIDGDFQSSVLRHIGSGTLDIDGVTIANGKYISANRPYGGCIYSLGNITLSNAHVENCVATGTDFIDARGGGVFAYHNLKLDRSRISDSAVHGDGTGARSFGGGAFAGGNVNATYSTISHNAASADIVGLAGGLAASGQTISITSSTIDSNEADAIGGICFLSSSGTTQIVSSTISGNAARFAVGGLYTRGNLKLANSTVAFNHDQVSASAAGVAADGSSLILESSILAGNGGPNGAADLSVNAATVVTASNNLVIAAIGVSLPPAECPQLDLLKDNGGPTLTHGITLASSAIDAGDNLENLIFDQTGNLRVNGPAADTGAVEWRAGLSRERIFVAGFDGLCDQ